ncbi:MAG: peptidase and domain protein [Candidatus Saccharibacteria bacterium]|nr:peptidase and domain protein [Candidatus Saccharibacteria bacterium]
MDFTNFDDSTRAPQGVSVHAGFPNAGSDSSRPSLSLDQLLISHPVSTFLFQISGQEWSRYGVFDGDIAIIDRAQQPAPRDLIIWWNDATGDFVMGRRQQLPAGASVWGCVTNIIHRLKPERVQ